jgi:hypothetical protein
MVPKVFNAIFFNFFNFPDSQYLLEIKLNWVPDIARPPMVKTYQQFPLNATSLILISQ